MGTVWTCSFALESGFRLFSGLGGGVGCMGGAGCVWTLSHVHPSTTVGCVADFISWLGAILGECCLGLDLTRCV